MSEKAKILLLVLFLADLVLVGTAAYRLTSATEETKPLISLKDFMGSSHRRGPVAADDGDPESSDRQRATANALKGNAWEQSETGSTPSEEAQYENADNVQAEQEDNLQDAKSRMKKLPGGGG